jgi:hypothetical protein
VSDGRIEIRNEVEQLLKSAGLEDFTHGPRNLAQHQLTLMLMQISLQRDEIGEKNAVQTLGRFRTQTQSQLAATFVGDETTKLAGQLINHEFIQLRLAECRTEDIPSALNVDVVIRTRHSSPLLKRSLLLYPR